jgi:hypothetical protein
LLLVGLLISAGRWEIGIHANVSLSVLIWTGVVQASVWVFCSRRSAWSRSARRNTPKDRHLRAVAKPRQQHRRVVLTGMLAQYVQTTAWLVEHITPFSDAMQNPANYMNPHNTRRL